MAPKDTSATDANNNFRKFFDGSDLTPETAQNLVKEGLKDADYGEFYQEIKETETLRKDKGEYKTISIGNSDSGFGFRVGKDNRVGYNFSAIFNEKALKDAIKHSRKILKPQSIRQRVFNIFSKRKKTEAHKVNYADGPQNLYSQDNPLTKMSLEQKIAAIDEIEEFAKSLDSNVTNVTVNYTGTAHDVHIITSEGNSLVDSRPNVSLAISIQLEDEHGNVETGRCLLGGAVDCTDVFDKSAYQAAAQKALEQAKVLLVAEEAPAGVMDIVLDKGWPAVILHEAVGHGLEGDFNRQDISVYSGKVGAKVATDEVTVIDQGDMPGERGSLHFDDEGTPTQQNVLIENGVLKGYLQDRQNAHLMKEKPTGNGRRQSYRHTPMPRMTNTYFKPGKHKPEDIIKSVKDGLYISDMGGGMVDITSGKFNMNAVLAYRIRDGKICEPVKGATLVGDGLTVINSITMVGNDLKLEKSAGTCGKNGQQVRVGSGQPTIRISNMTIGGRKK